jgi:hypothetical protein
MCRIGRGVFRGATVWAIEASFNRSLFLWDGELLLDQLESVTYDGLCPVSFDNFSFGSRRLVVDYLGGLE